MLEIGPGFGRSVVFFDRKQVWDGSATVHLYDANGQQTKYKQKHYESPPKWPDTSSFCGDLALLRRCLDFNGISNYKIHDAASVPLSALPGPFDLIYGFYSIGFHWSLDYYLDDLLPLLHDTTILICTLNKRFSMSDRLRQFSTRVIEVRGLKKGSSPERILVLSKATVPL